MATQVPTILERIVEQKRHEVERLPDGPVSAAQLKTAFEARGGGRAFAGALRRPRRGPVALIAEIKKASPSAGIIRADFDPVAIARAYESAGATCLSVLTDREFFQGSLGYLKQVRQAVGLPLLRKDFIIDERQILESIQWGADAILLITAILTQEQLRRFQSLALEAGLSALVEVHDEEELDRAIEAGSRLIGVNNRDLKTFRVDLATTERLAARLRRAEGDSGEVPTLVAESGIYTAADVTRLAHCGAQAVLVGESLMRRADIGAGVRELLESPRPPMPGPPPRDAETAVKSR